MAEVLRLNPVPDHDNSPKMGTPGMRALRIYVGHETQPHCTLNWTFLMRYSPFFHKLKPEGKNSVVDVESLRERTMEDIDVKALDVCTVLCFGGGVEITVEECAAVLAMADLLELDRSKDIPGENVINELQSFLLSYSSESVFCSACVTRCKEIRTGKSLRIS